MEEQAKPNEPKAEKKTTKKKTQVVDEAKVREAKKKVNDLLQGTGLEDASDVFVPPTQADDAQPVTYGNDNATSWLNDQVSALTQQVEDYEKTIQQLQKDNAALFSSLNGGGVRGNELDASDKAKIIELYKHFENVYMGRTNGVRYGQVAFSYPQQGSGVLDMFLSTFVFLQDYKQYQHWG